MSESVLLNHYRISSLNLSEWPAEKDEEVDSEEELTATAQSPTKSRPGQNLADGSIPWSRYSVLDQTPGLRSPSAVDKDGVEKMVHKLEPDPLGMVPNVLPILRARGLQVDSDERLRNRFFLSSTTFSPLLFLSNVYHDASTQDLLQGLEFLSRSIEKKSASLKVLVEANFERFVRAKATIDNVYNEMRDAGETIREAATIPRSDGWQDSDRIRVPNSRTLDKSGLNVRVGPGGTGSPSETRPKKTIKKHALVKEMDYGVAPIKANLAEIMVKAEELWGPSLGTRDKEEALRSVVAFLDKNRKIFELGGNIQDSIKSRDYPSVVEEYKRAQKYAEDARALAQNVAKLGQSLEKDEIHLIIITARMWMDVDSQISELKRNLWKRLVRTSGLDSSGIDNDSGDAHMEVIRVLMQLGVQDNPIWIRLLSRYDFLQRSLAAFCERTIADLDVSRRTLAKRPDPKNQDSTKFLKLIGGRDFLAKYLPLDTTEVLQFWEQLMTSLDSILSPQKGIIKEVIDFWSSAERFILGKGLESLPMSINEEGSPTYQLTEDETQSLERGTAELIYLIQDYILKTFQESRVNEEEPSSAQGWDQYAFWPPYSNSLSGSHYISQAITLVASAVCRMASLNLSLESTRSRPGLRSMVMSVRERCTQAVCAAWARDAARFQELEDWTKDFDNPELTKLPRRILEFETKLIANMQKVFFLPDVMNKPGAGEVIVPCSSKLIQLLTNQFIGSLYQVISALVENALQDQKPLLTESGEEIDEVKPQPGIGADEYIDQNNKNVRILFCLSNLIYIKTSILPQLTNQFEVDFSISLSNDVKPVYTMLVQAEQRLFYSFVDPIAKENRETIIAGITSPTWISDEKPSDAKPYVHEVLLRIVLTHTEVVGAVPSLVVPIIRQLQEDLCAAQLEGLRPRKHYDLHALMRVTLDVEFAAQTLQAYTTNKVTEIQSAIYLAMDERTDHQARLQLQAELPAMRETLKKLRERTKIIFSCLKKPRSQQAKSSATNVLDE